MKKNGIITKVTPDTIEINNFIIVGRDDMEFYVYIKQQWIDKLFDSEDILEFENIFEALNYCIDYGDYGELNKDLTDYHLITVEDKVYLEVNEFYVVETIEKNYQVWTEEEANKPVKHSLHVFNYEKFKCPIEAIYYCCTGKKHDTSFQNIRELFTQKLIKEEGLLLGYHSNIVCVLHDTLCIGYEDANKTACKLIKKIFDIDYNWISLIKKGR